MLAALQFGFHLPQFHPHPLLFGMPRRQKFPRFGLRADVREAEKLERLCSPLQVPFFSPRVRKFTEREEARLVGMKFQCEASQSLTQRIEKRHGIRFVLESNNKIVGVAHDDYIASRVPLSPLLNP